MARLLLLLLFIPFNSRAQNAETDKIYDFLNQVFKGNDKNDTNINITYLVDKPEFHYIKRLVGTEPGMSVAIEDSSIFTPSDIIQIIKRMYELRNFKFKKDKIQNVRIVSNKKVNKVFRKNGWNHQSEKTDVRDGFVVLSVPLFFDNGQKAIFCYSNICGLLCGGGQVAIYENIAGKWVRKKFILFWIN